MPPVETRLFVVDGSTTACCTAGFGDLGPVSLDQFPDRLVRFRKKLRATIEIGDRGAGDIDAQVVIERRKHVGIAGAEHAGGHALAASPPGGFAPGLKRHHWRCFTRAASFDEGAAKASVCVECVVGQCFQESHDVGLFLGCHGDTADGQTVVSGWASLNACCVMCQDLFQRAEAAIVHESPVERDVFE